MFEGYRLAVLFDEKDEVKSKGARWDQEESTWWIPKTKLQNHATVGDMDQDVLQWFNDRKMVMGQYGKFDKNLIMDAIPDSVAGIVKYILAKQIPGINPWTFVWIEQYTNNDVVKITSCPTLPSEKVDMWTLHDARKIWGELVDEGYTYMLDNSPENDENNS